MNYSKRKKIRTELKMNKCRYCGGKDNLTIDHKLPKSRGGTDDIKNLQCLCKHCNGVKSSMTIYEIKRIVKWWLYIKGFEHKNLKPLKVKSKQ